MVPAVQFTHSQSPIEQKATIEHMRILIIDNYDSYTFNLYQYCTFDVNHLPTVIRNDQFSWSELKDNILPYFDAVVISPGPGRPEHPDDVGVCLKLLQEGSIPILGVCLGLQGLAYIYGGEIIGASPPKHGILSPIYHNGQGLFANIPSPFNAVRYHSLIANPERLPDCLTVTATCPSDDASIPDVIMGLNHSQKPIWAVQFHPESICTEFGQDLIKNFVSAAKSFWKQNPDLMHSIWDEKDFNMDFNVIPKALSYSQISQDAAAFTCVVEKMEESCRLEPLSVFETVFRDQPISFWLDSARRDSALSRFSYMGDPSGPSGFTVKYSLEARSISMEMSDGTKTSIQLAEKESFFSWLAREYEKSVSKHIEYVKMSTDNAGSIPFLCGFVGLFGYEMKSESMHSFVETELTHDNFATCSSQTGPDAAFIFCDRCIIFDHKTGEVYLATLHPTNEEHIRKQQSIWRESMVAKLTCLSTKDDTQIDEPVSQLPSQKETIGMLRDDKDTYLQNVKASLAQINEGETYEVCLTTQLRVKIPKQNSDTHPFTFYKHLRSHNPAPYGAFFSFGSGFFVASSSPERFLQIDRDSWAVMKPIKGTFKRCQLDEVNYCPQARDEEDQKRIAYLQNNEKDRAENLMIVDLIRNDLNQFCEPMSVHVPSLMHVETYETVHQLVTTVKGKVRSDLNPVDAVMRSFPPGSMTGAPKLRTVHILESLERAPRGAYSGCAGFFSVTGSADFNVIIRTAVFHKDEMTGESLVSVGAGGAIIALSDPEGEFDEMLLKLNSVLPSLYSIYLRPT